MKIRFRPSDALTIVSGTDLDVPVSDPSLLFSSAYNPSYTSLYTYSVPSNRAASAIFNEYIYAWSYPRVPIMFIGFYTPAATGFANQMWQGNQYDSRTFSATGAQTINTMYYADFEFRKNQVKITVETPNKVNLTVKIWVLEEY